MRYDTANSMIGAQLFTAASIVLVAAAFLLGPGPGIGTAAPGGEPEPQAMADGDARAEYAGAEACRDCHVAEYDQWSASRHSRMVQPIDPSEVRAEFTAVASLAYRGRDYTFERDGRRYYIVEEEPGRAPLRHLVEYTLGNRRIQHFLTRRDDGALVLLPPSWDISRGEWFPLEDIVPTGDPEIEPVQVWNKNCFGCHVSQERKNFDTATLTYDSDWHDPGTNCETCHGPARAHVEHFEAGARGEPVAPSGPSAAKRALLPFAGEALVDMCATCHQNRYLLQADARAGEPFFDYFLTALPYTVPPDSPDPGYWADGRTRRFSNNSFGIWLSGCYLEGDIRCVNCHTSGHSIDIDDNPQLAPAVAGDRLCSGCHAGIVAEVETHSRHAAGSEGSSCLACHMPYTVSGIKAEMRDHSLAVPVPENTVDYGIPNACTECHAQRTPGWAAERIADWYGDIDSRPAASRWRRRAATFSAAQHARPEALGGLLEILRDAEEPFLMRANAAGYLRAYSTPDALDGLYDALVDPHPLVRAVAPLSIAAHPDGGSLLNDLASQLTDPSYAVRMNTAFALGNLGVGRADGAFGDTLRGAQDEYLDHLGLYSDSAPDQANRGALLALRGDTEESIAAYRIALRLDPQHQPARFGLGLALLQAGQRDDAVQELETLLQQAPEYPGLRALLAQLAGAARR